MHGASEEIVNTSSTAPPETHPVCAGERIVAGVMLAALVVCSVTEVHARLPFSPCVFRNATGLPCAGCGMTRGLTAMGHGRFREAWLFHPLSPFAYALAWGYVAAVLLAIRFPAVRLRLRLRPPVRRILLAAVFAAAMASWALTLTLHFAGSGRAFRPEAAVSEHLDSRGGFCDNHCRHVHANRDLDRGRRWGWLACDQGSR